MNEIRFKDVVIQNMCIGLDSNLYHIESTPELDKEIEDVIRIAKSSFDGYISLNYYIIETDELKDFIHLTCEIYFKPNRLFSKKYFKWKEIELSLEEQAMLLEKIGRFEPKDIGLKGSNVVRKKWYKCKDEL